MDFSSEFSRLFGGGCSVKGKDWNTPKYFDSQNNDCYAAEAALMSELTSEAYSNFGITVQYYIKDISIARDRLYGEDPLENIVRRFELKMYAESIPSMQKTYELQGMIFQEIVTAQCTIQHFRDASTLEWGTNRQIYESTVPKIGDIVYIEYSDTYYEVINVKSFGEDTAFLSTPITYTFSLRVWRNSHENVDMYEENADDMNEIRGYTELDEVFDLEKGGVNEPTSKVGPGSDRLEINTDLPSDVDSRGVPKDNVNDHVEYRYSENKTSNPKYYDPFDGF